MCQSCNCGLANALNNLFGPSCGCGQPSLSQTVNNLFGPSCGCGGTLGFSDGFISGVNAANAANGNNGCGCGNNGNNGCGCGEDYYARQYALGPYSTGGCGCGNF